MFTGSSSPDRPEARLDASYSRLSLRARGLTGALVGLVLTMAACASPGGGDGPPQGDPTGQCAVKLISDVTTPLTLSDSSAGCDYLVEGELRVNSTLTIEPGTEVRFAQDARLTFSNGGSLHAVGAAENRILLRGQADEHGYWYGLCFSDSGPSRLEHVDLMNAGKVFSGGSVVCRGGIGSVGTFTSGPVSILHTHISGASTSGLDAALLTLGAFERNVFSDNLEYGVRVSAAFASHLDVDSDYTGASVGAPNGREFVYLTGRLNEPGSTHIWDRLNAPYLTGGDEEPYGEYVIIDNDSHVIIAPGATFYFGERGGITVDRGATLTATGTEAERVVFTGAVEEPGSWLGLLTRDAALHLEWAEVSWAGAERVGYAGNVLITGARTNQTSYVRRTLLQGSAACGLYANSTTAAYLEHEENQYVDNATDQCLP